MQLTLEAENKSFGGQYQVHSHWGESTNCKMVFSIFLPPQSEVKKLPVLIWLSGLTCTEENFRIKAGVQRHAAEAGIIVVSPDTSPRGEDVPDDPEMPLKNPGQSIIRCTATSLKIFYRQ